MAKSPREVLNRLKYPIDLDGLTIDQALSDLAEIVRGEKKDTFGDDYKQAIGYNQALTDIAKLFEKGE